MMPPSMPPQLPLVLIVEDDDAVSGFLAKAVETGGWLAIAARTGDEALRCLREHANVAVVLVDGLLPDMHGVRLAELILEERATDRVGICFVSGALRDHQPADAGVAALSKPLRLREFLDVVRDLLDWRATAGDSVEERRAVVQRLGQGVLVGP